MGDSYGDQIEKGDFSYRGVYYLSSVPTRVNVVYGGAVDIELVYLKKQASSG